MRFCLIIAYLLVFMSGVHAEQDYGPIISERRSSDSFSTGRIKDAVDEFNRRFREKKQHDPSFELYDIRKYNDSASCSHCPEYLKVTGDVSRIVEEMSKNKKPESSDELPIRVKRLKFDYYTVQHENNDGKITCNDFFPLAHDEKKFDDSKGKYKVLAEQIVDYDAISALELHDKKAKKVIYTYRGEGSQKDIIIQVIYDPKEKKGIMKYYKYYPDSLTLAPKPETLVENPPLKDDSSLNMKPQLLKRGWIPKDLQLAEGHSSQTLINTLKTKSEGAVTVREGANLETSLRSMDNREIAIIKLKAALTGKDSQYSVVVPYSVKIGDDKEDPIHATGEMTASNATSSSTFVLGDKQIDYVKIQYSYDSKTHQSTYAVGQEYRLNAKEAVNVSYTLPTSATPYRQTSVAYTKKISKDESLILEARDANGKSIVLSYAVRLY